MPKTDPAGIKSLSEHLDGIDASGSRLGAGAARGMSDEDRARVEQHRRHILDYYRGTEPQGAFVDEGGTVFDLIPFEQQASLRGLSEPVPKPPEVPGASMPPIPGALPVEPLSEHGLDRFGNHAWAPPGTIPVRRQNPRDILAQRRWLNRRLPGPRPLAGESRFQQSDIRLKALPLPENRNYHLYAILGCLKAVTVTGGGGAHSLWRVPIDPSRNQYFSLNQQWAVHGTSEITQTVEPVTVCIPELYGNLGPSLGIFTTRDSYTTVEGSVHNLDRPAFVQTNNNWALGGLLSPWSEVGGEQRYIELYTRFQDGRWWFFAGGKTAASAVGYYPNSWWQNGPMAAGANAIEWGGEISATSDRDGTLRYPFLGSGHLKNTERPVFGQDAYIRNIHYYNSSGISVDPTPDGVNFGLIRYVEDWISEPWAHQPPWNRTLWFGGPAGRQPASAPVDPPPPATEVPVIVGETVSIPEDIFPLTGLHQLKFTGGEPEGSFAYQLEGADAEFIGVTGDGVLALRANVAAPPNKTWTFTARGGNAVGIGPPATMVVRTVPTMVLVPPLSVITMASNTPAGTVVGSIPVWGLPPFATLSCTMVSVSQAGLFTLASSGQISVASGVTLPAETMVLMTVTVTSGAMSDTETLRLVIEGPELPPVVLDQTTPIASGAANRFVAIIQETGIVRSSVLVAQSNPGTFRLVSDTGIYADVAIPANRASPYWIEARLGNYGGLSSVFRITMPVIPT